MDTPGCPTHTRDHRTRTLGIGITPTRGVNENDQRPRHPRVASLLHAVARRDDHERRDLEKRRTERSNHRRRTPSRIVGQARRECDARTRQCRPARERVPLAR